MSGKLVLPDVEQQKAGLEDTRRLRRTMRDLVALSTLPAVWIGYEMDGIARSLANALINTLSLDLMYVRVAPHAGGGAIELVSGPRKMDSRQESAARDAIRGRLGDMPSEIPDPLGPGSLRTAVVRFGIGAEQGILVACSRETSFPTEQDRLLLSVGANQTAIVAQRRFAEEQERQQREWLRVTLASIGEAVVATDIQGRVQFLNSAAERLTGWTSEEAAGKPIESVLTIVDEESRQPLPDPLARVLRDAAPGEPHREAKVEGSRAVLVGRGGAEHAVECSATAIRGVAGAVIGAVAVLRNVGSERRAEQLRHMRLQVTNVLNQAADTDQAMSGVLRAVCENLGWQAGFFWALDEESAQLRCRASWHRATSPMAEFESAMRGWKFQPGEGLPGRVLASGGPEWIPVITGHHGFPRAATAATAGFQSVFAAPVAVGERKLGVLEFFSAHMREPDGDLLGTMVALGGSVGQFIERRSAEEELRRSEEELAEFFENATIGLHWVGPDGTILRANRAELDMLGYTRDEYVGRSIADFHVDSRVICDILDRLSAGEKLADYPARLRCKDGSIRHVLIDSSVLWKDGRFIHTRCFTRDVTDKKKAETALAAARSQLHAALDAGAIATWTWDIVGNRLHADSRLTRLFDLPSSEAEGGILDRYVERIHAEDVERVLSRLRHSVETGEPYSADYRIVKADGAVRWVSARGRVEKDSSGRPTRMPGVIVDITERKALEDELRLRVGQLAEADRRKDEFLATLAHELRNPLAPIRNSLEILKMPRLDPATGQQVRDILERQVHHLVRLVDDLLDVSRVMRGKIDLRREPVELATAVARAVEMAQSLIESRGHRLSLSLPKDSLLVLADPVRLTQVIGNLLTNSAKYTDSNGHIWVSAKAEGSQVTLSVRDDGIGIAAEMLPHVFDLFVQADQAWAQGAGGLGIGLTLVKNLVEMHGGSVEAKSAGLGLGSEFVVRLPLLVQDDRPAHLPSEGHEAAKQAASSGLRILVVDDNRDAADSFATLLRLGGHEVHVAHDGAAAVIAASAYRPKVVFLDIGMPGMDGYEVARRIRAQRALDGTVLAALTGWGQQEDRRRTAEAGFDHHFVKPPDPNAVSELLETLSLASA